MGKVSTNGDGPSSLQTRCTNCRTVFEVSPELLASSDTRVRCGECLSIFDALANLRHPDTDDVEDDPPQTDRTAGDARTSEDAGEATDTDGSTPQSGFRGSDGDETGSLDVTYSDFDLFSGDAQLPEVAYLDETSDTPDFDFDTVDVDGTVGDETFSDTLFVDDATMEPTSVVPEPGPAPSPTPEDEPEFLEDDGTVEPPVFRYRDADATDVDGTSFAAPPAPPAPSTIGLPEDIEPTLPSAPKRRTSVGVWAIRSVMALLFVALLASLHLFRERGAWHNDPLIRPALVLGCRFTGCTVPSRVDLQSLRLLDKKVFTHPRTSDALVINVAFRNDASFDQRFPVLVVRLRDRLGRRVAERDFAPSEYLDAWAVGDTLEAGRRLDISLEVDDPGDGADSYEFEFREASG